MPINEQQIGELIGNVSGLSKSFALMQSSQENSRREVTDIFREMRDNIKDLAAASKISSDKIADAMAVHNKEDIIAHNTIENIVEWRKDIETRLDQMWDEHNNAKGILSASRLAGGALWAIATIGVGYFFQWHFK